MTRAISFLSLSLALALVQGCDAADENSRVVGYLESDRVEITASNDEPIARIPVAEGQHVEEGEILLQQDTARIAAQIGEAEAVLAQARARLDELIRGPREQQIAAARASVSGASQELEYLGLEYDRAKRVYERKLTSRESFDRAKSALDVAKADLEVEEARLQELLEGTTVEELRQAENAVREVEARLSLLRIDAGRLSAFAPADGIVDSILFEPGERAIAGQPMLIFLTGEQPHARVYVPESIRASIGSGTRARVFVDGLALPLEGRVSWVSSDAAFTPYFALTERDRGRLSYAAEIDFSGAADRLPDGVPVEVEFLIADQ